MSDGYAALVIDFTLSENDQTTIMTGPSSKVVLDTLNLTTSCLSEPSYVFPGWEGVPLEGYSGTEDRVVTEEINQLMLKDKVEKDAYRTAVTAWVIVLIILVIVLAALAYLTFIGRKALSAQNEDVQKLEQKLAQKREEVALLAKSDSGPLPMNFRGTEKTPGKL